MSKKVRRSREQIIQYLEQFRSSGMSQTKFAKLSGIHLTTLASWLRKERQAAEPTGSGALVPLSLQQTSPIKLVAPTGWSIEIPSNVPIDVLRRLLTAAGASC